MLRLYFVLLMSLIGCSLLILLCLALKMKRYLSAAMLAIVLLGLSTNAAVVSSNAFKMPVMMNDPAECEALNKKAFYVCETKETKYAFLDDRINIKSPLGSYMISIGDCLALSGSFLTIIIAAADIAKKRRGGKSINKILAQ